MSGCEPLTTTVRVWRQYGSKKHTCSICPSTFVLMLGLKPEYKQRCSDLPLLSFLLQLLSDAITSSSCPGVVQNASSRITDADPLASVCLEEQLFYC